MPYKKNPRSVATDDVFRSIFHNDGTVSTCQRKVRAPKSHRTVSRVTSILEEAIDHPGKTFVEFARALDAPNSSVHGFLQELWAKGWLRKQDQRYRIGPSVQRLTMDGFDMVPHMVSREDLDDLRQETGIAAFLAVRVGTDVISVAESGGDTLGDFEALHKIRRTLIATAAGKALLARLPVAEAEAYLSHHAD